MKSDDANSACLIVKRGDHNLSRKNFTAATCDVLYTLRDAGYTAYIAGGGVRDLLVGKNPKDFDIATNARPEQVKRLFRRSRLIGRRFRLVHVYSRGEVIEVSTFRAAITDDESKSRFHEQSDDGLILRDNIYGTPAQDAQRRDFTVNALFYNIKDYSIIDYVGGIKDIEAGLIRSIGKPEGRFIEDPVRMIRAVRFACTLGFQIEKSASDAIYALADKIALATPARMFEEIQKLFFCGNAKDVLHMLSEFGLLKYMLPEVADAMQGSETERNWLDAVVGQLDRWRKHNVKITAELFFALLFGLIHEQKIKEERSKGLSMYQAADAAVHGHLMSISSSVLIPKAIGRHISQIMSVQPHFLSHKTKKHDRFMKRACFHDAFIYFKVSSRFNKANDDQVHYWDGRIRAAS